MVLQHAPLVDEHDAVGSVRIHETHRVIAALFDAAHHDPGAVGRVRRLEDALGRGWVLDHDRLARPVGGDSLQALVGDVPVIHDAML
jgi:hypothetical protein